MEIKGHRFGTGQPVLCVPVVEAKAAEIRRTVEKMTAQGIPMLEWRMDWFEEVEDFLAVSAVLKELQPLVVRTVLLCTFRSKAQGGEGSLTREAYLRLNRTAAKSGVADLVDLEYFETDSPGAVIRELQERGVGVVCSHHDFQKTPAVCEMEERLLEMWRAGGDFAKLAVMPKEKGDVLRLMEAVLEVKKQCPDSRLIAMSMGAEGAISRLIGGWYGSEVTFASFGKASAPGQVDYQKAAEILRKLKECE